VGVEQEIFERLNKTENTLTAVTTDLYGRSGGNGINGRVKTNTVKIDRLKEEVGKNRNVNCPARYTLKKELPEEVEKQVEAMIEKRSRQRGVQWDRVMNTVVTVATLATVLIMYFSM
jgi:hypothetical protein